MKYPCAACGSEISSSESLFDYDGHHEHEYHEPSGTLTRILLFQEAPGCHLSGGAISDYTWFEGTTYRFADCLNCGANLGWRYYYGERRAFFGLIRGALTER